MKELDAISKTKAAIQTIRGQHVLLDEDLARVFKVETKRLNEQVKRNIGKFPDDFRFQLTKEEFDHLKSQSATSSQWGGRRTLPYAFTEHGALQVANVIHSSLADSISVFVIRAFIEMREVIATQEEIKKTQSISAKKEKKLSGFLKTIGPKLEQTFQDMMDTVIDPAKGSTIGSEAHEIISESISSLKERLKKTGLENEEIAARITKLLAEAEKDRALSRKTHAETEQLEFLNKVRMLRLYLESQKILGAHTIDQSEEKKIDALIQHLKEYNNL